VGVNLLSFTKAKRAQNVNDFESWIRGGVAPTLNAMDNNGEAFATVLICAVDFYNASLSDTSQTIRAHTATAVNIGGVLIIDGTRVNDVRVYEDGIVPTVISRYGTGGGNVPMVFEQQSVVYGLDDEQNGREELMGTLKSRSTSGGQQMAVSTGSVVRRLTPMECERLQGFPDGWTDGQADSNRYKQMGNAVAVPVVEWIISRMVGEDETN
jgi:site-specific DNA-cytosine methylase